MVEHPGMWDEARSLLQVGTVAGVQRKWPKPGVRGVSTRFGGAWVSVPIIGRGLTIKQEQKIAAFGRSCIWNAFPCRSCRRLRSFDLLPGRHQSRHRRGMPNQHFANPVLFSLENL
ncbi:hypothetical protein CCX46_05200 [Pseudomonas sp. RU47]|nr:hypothetical protein CCX46_05200 [Pseudomonas sp. RU47]